MQLEFEREGERRGGIAGREKDKRKRDRDREETNERKPIGVKRCNWVKQLSCS
jgi:hypothetical protein